MDGGGCLRKQKAGLAARRSRRSSCATSRAVHALRLRAPGFGSSGSARAVWQGARSRAQVTAAEVVM
eukprot:1662406-Rhodomonas_salina.2